MERSRGGIEGTYTRTKAHRLSNHRVNSILEEMRCRPSIGVKRRRLNCNYPTRCRTRIINDRQRDTYKGNTNAVVFVLQPHIICHLLSSRNTKNIVQHERGGSGHFRLEKG